MKSNRTKDAISNDNQAAQLLLIHPIITGGCTGRHVYHISADNIQTFLAQKLPKLTHKL